VEVIREKNKTAQADSIEALCTAEDSKDDVVELRARGEEKPALHRAIGDLDESTTFRDEACSFR
jgi:phosphotransferase system HPr-like phosphotransfer protein